jgi:hypothetical protein
MDKEKRAKDSPKAMRTDLEDESLLLLLLPMGKQDPKPPEAANRTTSMVGKAFLFFPPFVRVDKNQSWGGTK